MPNYPTLVFQISCDSHHRLQSYWWETARRSIRPNFSVPPVGKTMRWIKRWIYLLLWAWRALSPCKVWGRSRNAVGAKIWCLFFFVCWLRSESGAPCIRGVHSSNKHCAAVYCPISMRFSAFFHRWLLFQMHYIVLIFVVRWRHNFREIAVKNCKKSQNRRKSLCAPLRIDSWRIWKIIPRQ